MGAPPLWNIIVSMTILIGHMMHYYF